MVTRTYDYAPVGIVKVKRKNVIYIASNLSRQQIILGYELCVHNVRVISNINRSILLP